MLQNAYFLAKVGADTAENEQHFAEILPTDALSVLSVPRAASQQGVIPTPRFGSPGQAVRRYRAGCGSVKKTFA